jgi:hypothetical protein
MCVKVSCDGGDLGDRWMKVIGISCQLGLDSDRIHTRVVLHSSCCRDFISKTRLRMFRLVV